MNANVNFISVDRKRAINSYGKEFVVGETVGHQDRSIESDVIKSFEVDEEANEVKVYTDRGWWAYLDFIEKLNENITITINTGNDAFHNPGPPSYEVARILRELADKLENSGGQVGEYKLMDINGQNVGEIKVS